MEVYIVTSYIVYETKEIHGVYDTLELAEKCKRKVFETGLYATSELQVEPFVLNECDCEEQE